SAASTVRACAARQSKGGVERRPMANATYSRTEDSQRALPATGIAIIGMACRFPGANTLDAFWQILRDGKETISFFSDEEMRDSGVDEKALGHPRFVKAGSVLDDVEFFDADFFGLSPREAELLDPQQRLFMECVWESLEHAGYDPCAYAGAIGIFAGSSMSTYVLSNIYQDARALRCVNHLPVLLGN